MSSLIGSAKRRSTLDDWTADDAAAAEGVLSNPERDRLIAAIERGRADVRAGRETDDEELTKELDEALGPLE